MRSIFLLFLLISLLESSPSISECKYETYKASICLMFIPGDIQKIVPKEEFDAKKPRFQDFLTCFGEPKCEHSQMLLKIEKSFMGVQERMCEIHSCLGNGTLELHGFICQFGANFKNRADPESIECMIENVGKEEKCSSADLEKFKESMKLMPELFRMKRDYKEKEEEVRRMNVQENDN